MPVTRNLWKLQAVALSLALSGCAAGRREADRATPAPAQPSTKAEAPEGKRDAPLPRLVITLEDGSVLQGSSEYKLFEPHPKAPYGRALVLTGSVDDDFLSIDLVDPPEALIGTYELRKPDGSSSSSSASARLRGEELVIESGRIDVSSATRQQLQGVFELTFARIDSDEGELRSVRGSFQGKLDSTCWTLEGRDPAPRSSAGRDDDELPQWQLDADSISPACVRAKQVLPVQDGDTSP